MIFIQIPKAGLGNKMIVFFLGYCLGKKLNTSVVYTGWVHFSKHIFKNQKSKRLYTGLFQNTKGWHFQPWFNFKKKRYKPRPILRDEYEAYFTQTVVLPKNNPHLLINTYPNHLELFTYLLPFKTEIKAYILERLIKKEVLYHALEAKVYDITVHIRLGDFKEVNSFQEFMDTASARTPLDYFYVVLDELKALCGDKFTIGIFTDGSENELGALLEKYDNIELAVSQNEISDIIRMSKSQLIITSSDSTFGLWACFLSDAHVIVSPKNKIEVGRKDYTITVDPRITPNISGEGKQKLVKALQCN